MNEIPVYLFTGFMDSGKTTLVKETLFDDGFTEGGRSVVICCEDGDVEYDEEELKKINARLVMVENEEDFTEEFLNKVQAEYLPEQVFIEYNGTWGMGTLMDMEHSSSSSVRTAAWMNVRRNFRLIFLRM